MSDLFMVVHFQYLQPLWGGFDHDSISELGDKLEFSD